MDSSTTTNTSHSLSAPSHFSNGNCISYNPSEIMITIRCKSAIHLTDIDNQLNDNSILDKQEQHYNTADNNNNDDGSAVWLLNAGILVDKGGYTGH